MGARLPAWGVAVAAVVAVPAGDTAVAQDARPRIVVDVSLKKEVVVRDPQGREHVTLEEVTSSGPGDTLVYRIHYVNRGEAPAVNPRVVDPVPPGTELVPGSWDTEGADFSVSVDGGRTFHPYPVRRTVTQPDGASSIQEVALSSYTHVRWTCREPLAPGDARSAVFKVKVR
ncbi:MAG TPA: hypothetical protein VJV23_05915 [Candidatus Polarisedimenticolia bacterium]|nr:hypothetical protein [Candidatus Polarisedimenticolia bacterium]